MATTGNLIHELAIGIRTTADVAVASGLARFYQLGTLTPAAVYSDTACTSAITQPLTLNAAGEYRYAYSLVPLRMIVKASDDATTVVDGNVNVVRAAQVFITNSAVNGGIETPLDDYFTGLAALSGGTYVESASATARGVNDWLRADSVQADDFNAAGDDVADDTTFLQAGIDHCASTGKPFHIPAGTYKITSALTMTTGQCTIYGDGPKLTVIKNYGTTTNGLTFNFGGSTDAPFIVRDLSITAATTSSGAAIADTNANNVRVIGVETSLHRKGIDVSGATGCIIEDCTVLSTDGNAAGVGIAIADATCRVINCRATAATGTGFQGGVMIGCAVPGATATGFSAMTVATGCVVSAAVTTGFSLSALSRVSNCSVTGASTTAISSAATAMVDNCVITGSCTNAVLFTAGNAIVQNVHLSGAASGTAFSIVTGTISQCWLSSSANVGVSASGADAVASNCVVSGTTTGISMTGARARVIGCTVGGAPTTGISITGANSAVSGCSVSGTCTTGILANAASVRIANCSVTGTCTTGISLAAAATMASNCVVTASTTGFSVGGVANVSLTGNVATSNTTDLVVNSSATLLVDDGNTWTTVTDTTSLPQTWTTTRRRLEKLTFAQSTSLTPTHTPSIASGTSWNVFRSVNNAGATCTIAATSTTGLQADRDFLRLTFIADTIGTLTLSWNGQYDNSHALPTTIANARRRTFIFVWDPAGDFSFFANSWTLLCDSGDF